MIGNDIVDLQLAALESDWRRNGFLEKVFTSAELRLLSASEEQELLVWLLWSMKEAAYKAHQRRFTLPRRLNWKAQECGPPEFHGSKASGVVRIGQEKYFCSSEFSGSAIHTVAVADKEINMFRFFREGKMYLSKEAFLYILSEIFGMESSEIQLKKNEAGVPFVCGENPTFPEAFSFSDHGRFSGFCVSLRNY